MAELKGSKTHGNLKDAFAGESQANRRYLYFAKVADVEGHPDLAGLFRDTAEGETGDAHGHLDYLRRVGDPATGEPIADTSKNRHTLIFQIEEMCRAEGMTRDDQIQAEIDVYNALMPTEDSLSATLFIELPRDADPYVALRELVGLDEHVVLHIGPHAIRAAF